MLSFATSKIFRHCMSSKLVRARTTMEISAATVSRLVVYPPLLTIDYALAIHTFSPFQPYCDLFLFAHSFVFLVLMYPVVAVWCADSYYKKQLNILSMTSKKPISKE